MSYAKRSDSNQQPIIDALRKCGASVHSLHRVGSGCPDLLVGFRGKNYLLELKRPASILEGTEPGKLTEKQKDWHAEWNGQVCVVRHPEEALVAIGAR
jgi:hypothetical protein